MEDRKLIREIQKGNKELLNVIAEKYYDDIYRFCCFQTGNPVQAYDLAQETFLKFIRMADRYQYRNLKGYLLTIARNCCIDYYRENARSIPGVDEFPEEGREDERLAGLELRECILQAIQQLPPEQREAVVLYYYYDIKLREIAQMTQTGVSTVKSRIRQGKLKLKRWIEEEEFK